MKSFVDSVVQWSRFQRNRNIVIQAVFLFFVTLLGVYFFVRASGLELSLSILVAGQALVLVTPF